MRLVPPAIAGGFLISTWLQPGDWDNRSNTETVFNGFRFVIQGDPHRKGLALLRSLANQEARHQKKPFGYELEQFVKKYGLEWRED